MSETVGLDCKATRSTGGSFGSPTWTGGELTQAQDVSIARERTEISASNRGSKFEKFLVGLKKYGVDIKLVRDNADTNQLALETAYEAGSIVTMAFSDGVIATVGTRYMKCDMIVTKFAEGEPLEGFATIDITLKLHAGSSNDPVATTVAA